VRGKRFQGAIGEVSKATAREIAEKKRVEALEGKLLHRPLKAPLFGRYDANAERFTDAAGEYLAYYQQNHKPRSFERMHYAMLALAESFNGRRLDEITPFLIERHKAQRKDAGYSDATVNRELACLKHLFSMASRWGWVRDNPVKEVKLFRENNARLRWLMLEEEAVLLAHCDQQLKTFVLTAVDTGFRACELQSLRWQGVDFQRRTVSVASGYTKNGEPRTNPTTKRLQEALQMWRVVGNGNGDGMVFGKYRYREPFERARDAAKLGKDVCFHSLRHTFISRLVLAGVDVRTVQELAGHKTITMTMRYAHLAPEHKRRAVDVLDAEVTAKVTTVIRPLIASA
jgi:integrase